MKRSLFLLPVCVLFLGGMVLQFMSSEAVASEYNWKDTGQLKGAITELAHDGVHNVLYAATPYGIWRCKNPNTSPTWTHIGALRENPEDEEWFDCLAYDPVRNKLYAGGFEAMMRCDNPDISPSWSRMGLVMSVGGGEVYSLAFDKNNNVLYAGGQVPGGGIWRCKDPDKSTDWVDTGGAVKGTDMRKLVYDDIRNVLYAGYGTADVWRCDTPDTSPTWKDTGGPGNPTDSLAYDSVNGILYAGSSHVGIFRCDNPKESPTWSAVSNMPPILQSRLRYYLTFDANHNFLFVAISDYSSDLGIWCVSSPNTAPYWSDTGGGMNRFDISTIDYDEAHSVLYAGTEANVNPNPSGPPQFEYHVWSARVTSGQVGPFEPTSRTWGHDSIGTPTPGTDWYLAEGCTAGGFETWVLVQNPGDTPASVQVTYMTPEGAKPGPSETLPPNSRKTYNVANTVPDSWQVSTKVHSDKPVVAERAMYGGGRSWGTDSIGASETSANWYLAEGCTAGGFETWVLVQNPGDTTASVDLTYMTETGQVAGPHLDLAANSRQTVNVANSVPNTWSVSTKVTSQQPVVAERAVYWNNRKGAHDSIGVASPATTWYLAEGCTAGGFETWVLVQNPGDTAASVDLTYMTETGQVAGPHLDLAAYSRHTVNVANSVPNTWSVSTKVTSKQPVIAERAVYWNNRIEGHDSIGTTEPAKTWYLAEGSTGPGFETWVLVQNPNDTPADVQLTYMTPAASEIGPTASLPPNSRMTFNVAETVPGIYEVSTEVTSNVPVIAERAMYGDRK